MHMRPKLMSERKTAMGGKTREVKVKGHVLPSHDARVIRFPGAAGAGSRDRSGGHEAVTRGRHRPKPAWRVLYGTAAVCMLLFLVAEVESPTGGWRILTECLGTVLILGIMALWVHANRTALALVDDALSGEGPLFISVGPLAQQPSSRLNFPGAERGQRSRAQMRPAEKEDPKCFAK